MDLIQLVIILAVVGVLLWLIQSYLPMDPTIKRIINIVVVIAVVLWLLNLFFDLGSLHTLRVGRH